jgi:hypothetical protein
MYTLRVNARDLSVVQVNGSKYKVKYANLESKPVPLAKAFALRDEFVLWMTSNGR